MTTEAVTLTDDEIRRIEFDGLADTDVHTAPNALIAVFESILATRLAGAGAQVTEAAVSAAAERLYQFNEWGIDSKGDYYENQTPWDSIGDGAQDVYRREATAALSAALPHMGTGQAEADLRARITELEAERDKALDDYAEREQRWHWNLIKEGNAIRERDAARAERDDLRARISALADNLERRMMDDPDGNWDAWAPSRIRALLDRTAAAEGNET